ncbi:hypothetical protein C2G38_891927 [Gigaspora rosea]|uniref:Secreted protein n=1 Tax=Gigaspora rosea TaxID=44941 RepID=A0A397U5J1_9GLOM|nr:hypothetical protein C2G38_891927 [Gigaspora rosea]
MRIAISLSFLCFLCFTSKDYRTEILYPLGYSSSDTTRIPTSQYKGNLCSHSFFFHHLLPCAVPIYVPVPGYLRALRDL